MKRLAQIVVFGSAVLLYFASQSAAQTVLTMRAVGNGERVRIAFQGKSKTINLEEEFAGDFIPGGTPPHRYTTLLSAKKGEFLYLIVKFQSGPTLGNPMGFCGGDRPTTLLLIKTDQKLNVKTVQTEIYASCIYNGTGRYMKGKPKITKDKILISFEEGTKKFDLIFDANEAEKGLQLNER